MRLFLRVFKLCSSLPEDHSRLPERVRCTAIDSGEHLGLQIKQIRSHVLNISAYRPAHSSSLRASVRSSKCLCQQVTGGDGTLVAPTIAASLGSPVREIHTFNSVEEITKPMGTAG